MVIEVKRLVSLFLVMFLIFSNLSFADFKDDFSQIEELEKDGNTIKAGGLNLMEIEDQFTILYNQKEKTTPPPASYYCSCLSDFFIPLPMFNI